MLLEKSFYFVRHAETDYNLHSLCAGGKIDTPLNQTGALQAGSLREKISSLAINKVICSPLKRTIQTAMLATGPHPKPSPSSLVIEHGIKECDLGDFDGQPVPRLIQYMETTQDHVPFPNGESRRDLDCRVKEAVNKSLGVHGEGILFVSHGLVYQSLLKITGIPVHHIHNAALIQFKPQNGSWGILSL
jgi:probable phosphoglycerate mutase